MKVAAPKPDKKALYEEAARAAGGEQPAEGATTPKKKAAPKKAADAPADEITISLNEMAYTPGEVTIKADTDVTLRLVNDGLATHNLTIDALGLRGEMLAAGEEMELTVNLPAGDYSIGCDVPGHRIAGMTGVIHAVA